ncbi:MAG: phosphatidylserine decarboxylase family protein [Bacteroidota bacterium]|nr:phosphatidylserine decarboxylase family protein [Bacteroidota bacterium]
MIIHKEGRQLLKVLFFVLLAINFLVLYFYPTQSNMQVFALFGSILIFLIILQFFRSPRISSIINKKHILAPADGRVVVIENVEEKEYFNGTRKQISIFMSPVNVHVNRNPVSGTVKFFKYHPGQYLVAWHPKSSTDNERTTLVIEMPNGMEVLYRQIAGALARRIKWYVKEGDQVTQGEEFGFIKFGSRVDVFVPIDAEIKVSIGDKTRGGSTVLAVLSS